MNKKVYKNLTRKKIDKDFKKFWTIIADHRYSVKPLSHIPMSQHFMGWTKNFENIDVH